MEQNGKQVNLIMKHVEMKQLSEFNDLLRYVFQITNAQLNEVGWKPKEIEREKVPVLAKANVLGYFDNGRLISQVATYPMHVNIHGTIYSMGGMTGVGTYPEYANMGLAKSLIYESLLEMKKCGQTISYLYPYSIPYYRKKGWEIFCDHLKYQIPDHKLPRLQDDNGMIRRVEISHEDIIKVYDVYARNHHGAMIRTALEWQEYWRWENDDIMAAIYYDVKQEAQGFILYSIENEVFNIKEILYNTQDARKGIWNFIVNHQTMINEVRGNQFLFEPIAFLLDDSEIEEVITPYFMARIVDVKAFLEKFPFLEVKQAITFQVEDPLLDFNTGLFTVQIHHDITHELSDLHVKCDIQTLVTMLMNYRRPTYLNKIERLLGSKEAIAVLEQMIPNHKAYFSDYF